MPNLRLPNFLFCPLASNIIQLRKEEYRSRFRLKPHQSKYLDGWGYEMLRKTGQEWLYVANILMGFKFLILMGGAWQWIPEICWAFSRRCTLSICNRIAVAARGAYYSLAQLTSKCHLISSILVLNWLEVFHEFQTCSIKFADHLTPLTGVTMQLAHSNLFSWIWVLEWHFDLNWVILFVKFC